MIDIIDLKPLKAILRRFNFVGMLKVSRDELKRLIDTFKYVRECRGGINSMEKVRG